MRILVTGGTGFIGSHIARHFIHKGDQVVITGHDAEQKILNCVYIQPNLLGIDWNDLSYFDIVFHQAAINDTTSSNKKEMFRANVAASKKMFTHVVHHGCKRIVYASSTAVYGDAPAPYKEDSVMNPLNPYAESKKALDEFAMQFAHEHPGITIVGLRYCNVYGPGEAHKGRRASMIYQLAQQMLRGNPKLFKYGEQKRDYVYITDVVQANLLASQAQESCIVNCGSGKATSFNTLVEILNNVLGTHRIPQYIDNPYADRYQNHTECDMTLAQQKLRFIPQVDIKTGIEEYYKSGF